MAGRVSSFSFGAFMKNAWQEKPDLVCSLGLGAVGIVTTVLALLKLKGMGDRKNMYREYYTVIREEDVEPEKFNQGIYN